MPAFSGAGQGLFLLLLDSLHRHIPDELKAVRPQFEYLSMGMSGDYRVALEEVEAEV